MLSTFHSCDSLQQFVLPPNCKSILKEVFRFESSFIPEIPNGVEYIGEGCFIKDSPVNDKTLILPASIKYLARNFFTSGITGFGKLILKATVPPKLFKDVINWITEVYVPDESLEVYFTDEGWSEYKIHIHPMSEYQP